MADRAVAEVPGLLKALSHPLRWSLVQHLARSDHRVGELVDLVRQPQNLVSYHLRSLRDAELVTERRSSRDARDIYYSLDLENIETAFNSSTQSVHPALRVVVGPGSAKRRCRPLRVLFLCTQNSARSQFAEAILRGLSKGEAEAFSAGSQPSGVHPMTLAVLEELGYGRQDLRSKSIDEFAGQSFDYIITVCDKVREVCPAFPGDPVRIHWSVADPIATQGSETKVRAAFRQTASELATRIRFLLLTTTWRRVSD